MIRPLEERDYPAVIAIVNESWKTTYAGYVNPALLDEPGCAARAERLERDFITRRLAEYVWAEDAPEGRVLALLSMGDTADPDLPGVFEIWRIYVDPAARGRGIGGRLLAFAEGYAREQGYTRAVIWAFRENARAGAFYQSRGYRPDREEYLGEPYRAWGIRRLKQLNGEESAPSPKTR